MPLTIPNSFTTNTKIEGVKIQQNVDAIKEYLNGGIVATDLNEGEWVATPYIMKGLYFSTDNSYEMVSGLYKGIPLSEMPVFNPGYAGLFTGNIASGPVPGTGISFYLEKEADVHLQINLSPRGLPLAGGVDGAGITIRLDGGVDNYSQQRISKEDDMQPSSGASTDIVGFYRRRFYQMTVIYPTVAAGYHDLQLFYRGTLRAVPIKFESYSLRGFYRP